MKSTVLFAQGGNGARVVNSVLGLKSYSEWRQSGGNGIWRYGGNTKPTTNTGNFFIRKNSDPFQNSLSRNLSVADKFLDDHNQNVKLLQVIIIQILLVYCHL